MIHCKGRLLLAATLAALVPASVHAGAITPFTTIFDTDLVVAGTGGLRDGAGTITVSGVSGPVTGSYLYWHGPTNSSDANAMAGIQVNGNAVTGTNIGFSDDNFWGRANSQAYRANTTAVINGNGAYNLTGFNTATTTGNGAAAAVFHNDGNALNNRDVVIFNGNDSNFVSAFDAAGWDFTLSGINYSGGSAFLRLFVSDGQNFGPADDGTLTVNGTPIATGGIFQGDSLPGESVGNGNLFDIKTYDITSLLVPGANSLRIRLDAGVNDALSAVAALIDLPAGAAPPMTVPVPSTLFLIGAALAAALLSRRAATRR